MTFDPAHPTETIVDAWMSEYGHDEVAVASLLCDRHPSDAVAFTFVQPDMSAVTMTYGTLAERSRRLATALAERGVRRGDRVAILLEKRPELVVSAMALWRLGAVHVPLFTAFAGGAIRVRLEGAQVGLVITEPAHRHKLDGIAELDVWEVGPAFDRVVDDSGLLDSSVAVGGDGPMLHLFTSGTTGKPKGVVVPVRALAAFHSYLHFSLDVRGEDVFWNAADPGWAYGLYYGIVGPMVAGRANVLFNGAFTPEAMLEVLRSFSVTNFAGAPTMYRALAKSGQTGSVHLRRASAAGEPLTPDVVAWARERLGTEVRDHYGQTETGMTIGNSWHPDIAEPLRPSSMGRALPGYVAGLVDGQIAIDVARSPLFWFAGYAAEPAKTSERFSSDHAWYLTADTGRLEDGHFYFTARDDDVILAAGYRIGPFDVESVLITHEAVADVAVVGRPDPQGIRGERVEAYVVLRPGLEASDELAAALQQKVRDEYSKHAYPRTVHFVASLPKTPSGKVQRFLLRQN